MWRGAAYRPRMRTIHQTRSDRPWVANRSTRAKRLHGLDILGKVCRQHFVAACGDGHVVLDAYANAPPFRWHAGVVRRDVDTGLDRHHHAGFQYARLVIDAV